MKAPPFDYLQAESVEAALEALAEHGDEAKILAGGQSLVPMLNLRLASPGVLVDITGIGSLRAAKGGGGVRFGATVTHAKVEDLLVPDPSGGLLPAVAEGIGYRAVRNRGTVAGSLIHADPSAEWPVVMSALDASVQVRSVRGERFLPVRELYLGHFVSVLEPDELVVAVDIPAQPVDTRWGFDKRARKVGEFADSLAVALVHDADSASPTAEIWLGAASDVPLRLSGVGEVLAAEPPGPRREGAIRALVADALPEPVNDEARYHRHLHAVATCRALDRALSEEPK